MDYFFNEANISGRRTHPSTSNSHPGGPGSRPSLGYELCANTLQFTGNPDFDLHQLSTLTAPPATPGSMPLANHANDFCHHIPDAGNSQAVLYDGYSNPFNGVDQYNNQLLTRRVPAATNGLNFAQPTNYHSHLDTNTIGHPYSYNTGTPWLSQAFNLPSNDSLFGVTLQLPPIATQPLSSGAHPWMSAYPIPIPTPELSSGLPPAQDQYPALSTSQFSRVQHSFNPTDLNSLPSGFKTSGWLEQGLMNGHFEAFPNHSASSTSYDYQFPDPYPSITLPALMKGPFVNSQAFLSNHHSSRDDRVSTPDGQPSDVPELPNAVGPCRTTRAKQLRMRVRRKRPHIKTAKAEAKATTDERLDEGKVLAPPSPEIGVQIIPLPGEIEPTKVRHSRGGCCPSNGEMITVVTPVGISHVPFIKVRPVIAKDGDFYRCRWDGCRFMVPATKEHIRAHMRCEHNVRGTEKIACRWRPPIRVRMPGSSEPVHTANHALSYACDLNICAASVINHIDSHLNHEQQPNPNVKQCKLCGCGVVERGGHRCVAYWGGKVEEQDGQDGREGGDGREGEEEREGEEAREGEDGREGEGGQNGQNGREEEEAREGEGGEEEREEREEREEGPDEEERNRNL